MAKGLLTDDAGATKKKKKKQRKKGGEASRAFSDLELDVARQLVQLSVSGNSDESAVDSSSTAAKRVLDDGTEASSALNAFCPSVEDIDDSEGSKRRRKFRSLQRIYELTEPLPPVSLCRSSKVVCR